MGTVNDRAGSALAVMNVRLSKVKEGRSVHMYTAACGEADNRI